MIVSETQSSLCPQNTSFTGSWSGISRSTELASSVCLSPLDSPPSKTYKWPLKFEVFCVFLEKNTKNGKNVTKFLTGLCQDDVTTSSGDVISRKKLHSLVRDKILGKVTEGIFKICCGSRVMQQKVGLGVNLPPPLVLCVLNTMLCCFLNEQFASRNSQASKQPPEPSHLQTILYHIQSMPSASTSFVVKITSGFNLSSPSSISIIRLETRMTLTSESRLTTKLLPLYRTISTPNKRRHGARVHTTLLVFSGIVG